MSKKKLSLEYLISIANEDSKCPSNYDLNRLKDALPGLLKLQNLIGMDSAKETIVKIVNLYVSGLCNMNKDMMHTMIQGGSGTGKTTLARILGEIYWRLGILDNDATSFNVKADDHDDGNHRQLRKRKRDTYVSDEFLVSDEDEDNDDDYTEKTEKVTTYKFIEASRTDCIDRYQGGTANKTANLIKSALGGVLFIDEAYSLGNTGAEDTYNKECIDTLTSLMEKYKGKVIIILGGYRHSMEDTLLRYNEGLSRRITFNICTDGYTAEQLSEILMLMVSNLDTDEPWTLNTNRKDLDNFFINNMSSFPHMGGDIETLLFHIKMNHSTRLISSKISDRKKISMMDIKNGYQDYDINRHM